VKPAATSVASLLKAVRRRRRLPSPEKRRAIREAAGVSRREVAAALGVAPETVWRYEAGTRQPRGPARERYIDLLEGLAEVAE
jgi:DNA-binding transcriptional regulator YiaG